MTRRTDETAHDAGNATRRAREALADRDWAAVARALDDDGHAVLPRLLGEAQCEALAALYPDDGLFRSRVVMARHGFGRGEYKYFDYPLPPLVEALRHAIYRQLAPMANCWNERLGEATRYPPTLAAFLRRCHAAGQGRPTPLLLTYGEGDYNCLHQDLYGTHVFPLQLAILLSRPGVDFDGGEFVMTQGDAGEQRADVVPLVQGDAVVFGVHRRPVPGRRGGWRQLAMRHGVSRVLHGHRRVVGIIFHDAR
jgi:hypothetical protein